MKTPWMRGAIYFFVLCYLFIGVAIVSDVFMEAIEVITSQEREMPGPNGTTYTVTVWNDTVANLTLMALGSSAPEILLAVVEALMGLGSDEKAVMGAATIVGSAAFNLLIITGICISSLQDGETRKVDEMGVFACTATFSILAYVWMVFCLSIWTPNEVTLEEALITLGFFPLLVLLAYVLDRHWCPCCNGSIEPGDDDSDGKIITMKSGNNVITKSQIAAEVKKYKAANPHMSDKEVMESEHIQKSIAGELGSQIGKVKWSIAKARMAAVKQMSGGKRMSKLDSSAPTHETAKNHASPVAGGGGGDVSANGSCMVQFSSPTYAVREDEGMVNIWVMRTGKLDEACSVNYATADNTATAVEDYVPVSGTLDFAAGETRQLIQIEIIDDDVCEDDEDFLVELSAASGCVISPKFKICVVTIIDDDVPGILAFKQNAFAKGLDDELVVDVEICRNQGCDGFIQVDIFTEASSPDNTAEAGVHYEECRFTVDFVNGETSKVVPIPILPEALKDTSDNLNFFVHIANSTGGSKIGKKNKCNVLLTNDSVAAMIANIQDRLEENKERFEVGTHSWHQRFIDAITAEGDEDDDDGGSPPGAGDIVAHVLSLPWKIVFAFIAPTDYCGGAITFVMSLACIGIVTAIIEQVAKMFGCVIGIPQEITSITIVALGTSLPDTFASMIAAKEDDNADASIGNITGSNSVNVFLGLGLPWTISTIYYGSIGQPFVVQAGGLNYMVTVFSCMAVVCILFLLLRRKVIGAELGGPKGSALASTLFLVSLWVGFIVASSLYTMASS